MMTNETGQVVWGWESTAFGVTSVQANPDGDGAAEHKLDLRFAGQIEDPVMHNIYYNYFRDYNPALGWYLQSDPIGLDGEINIVNIAVPLLFSIKWRSHAKRREQLADLLCLRL